MLSKCQLITAGLLSASAYNLQEFIPDQLKEFVPVNVEFNSTDIDITSTIKTIEHESKKMIKMGHHHIHKISKELNDFDLNKLKPESWKHYDDVETDPDFDKTFEQIVRENGYIFESHPVTTQDGYILNVYRINSKDTKPGAKAVFLQHGIVDSADCWIMHRPDIAPAFQLVNKGYDVWLGNQRGTKYSPGHQTLNPEYDRTYWEFSWTEMGDFDAPA